LRNWVLILALANLGVLAVFAWVVEEPVPSTEYTGPGITLLRELDRETPIARSAPAGPPAAADFADDDALTPAESASSPGGDAAVTELSPPVDGDTDTERCVSIGPFPEITAADSAFETLVDAGFEPARRFRQDDVWDGYWVYIRQIGDLASARAFQAELAENGIEDTQVVSTSDNGNLLSLGVFSEITRAGSLAERVNQIGYEATIADNLSSVDTQWLDVTVTGEQSLALDLLQAPGQISRLELRECEPDEAE
jgi:hypothetical protein